jgi:hypothetical protein
LQDYPPWAGLAPEEHSKNQILKNFLLYHISVQDKNYNPLNL